jgi:hypothetical protein
MIDHEVQWTTPAPLWTEVSDPSDALARAFFRRPAILRFASDAFMPEFMTLLESDPAQLKALLVRRETWFEPAGTPVVRPVEKLPAFAKRLQRSRLASFRAAGTSLLAAPGESTPDTAFPTSTASTRPLKLYQPGHQRFYLITACLVCRLPGQPDRRIEPGNQERASFVIRRVISPDGKAITEVTEDEWSEYAYVSTPSGVGWRLVSNVRALATDEDRNIVEEQNPLFGVSFTQDDGRRRRLLGGLIPVGKREQYVGAPERNADGKIVLPDGAHPPPDPREVVARAQVIEPWKSLIDQAAETREILTTPDEDGNYLPGPRRDALLKTSREQLQSISWLILLDFATYLEKHMPRVWNALNSSPPPDLSTEEDALLAAIQGTAASADLKAALTNGSPYTSSEVWSTLDVALKSIGAYKQALESITTPYNRNDPDDEYPPYLFPLADPAPVSTMTPPNLTAAAPLPPGTLDPDKPLAEAQKALIDALEEKIVLALPQQLSAPVPPLPLAAQPVMQIERDSWFVIRCVFERSNCGPLQPTVVSDASEPFQMASFFDPDAPARPIRIALPIDTSPAGLRKFDKNTAFMISDMLCGQINRVKSLGLGDLVLSVLPWPFHKDLSVPDGGPCTEQPNRPDLSLGMICSLSIPIITICALLLLMIIVSLLDIIFKWIPFFIICFPLPKFKGKPDLPGS